VSGRENEPLRRERKRDKQRERDALSKAWRPYLIVRASIVHQINHVGVKSQSRELPRQLLLPWHAGHLKLTRCMSGLMSKVVENSTRNPNIGGSNPITATEM